MESASKAFARGNDTIEWLALARSFHDLRRSAVENMVDAGIPQVTVIAISGRRSDSVFRRYAIRTTRETRRALCATVLHLRGAASTATEQLRSE